MNSIIEKLINKTESVLGTLSEDDLLTSSQDTIVDASKPSGARHSTPLQSSQQPKSTSGKVDRKRKNRKSSGTLLKARYQRAKFILAKIAKNEQEGNVHERDADDKAKFEAVVREYEALPRQASQPQTSALAKRNRSQEVNEREAKRKRNSSAQGVEGPTTSAAATAKAYSEVARDHLQLALVDAKSNSGKEVLALWGAIEGRLSGMVVEHLMANQGPAPLFDSDEVCRGCRVIKCADEFSRGFLEKCVDKVSNAWEGLSLRLIPASEIPRRPRARIWLPKMKLDSKRIIQCLKLQNPAVPMDDWSVIKMEEPQKNSSTVLLLISNESLGALEKQQFKLRFGLRMAKLKVFPASSAPDDNLEELGDLRLSETDADAEQL